MTDAQAAQIRAKYEHRLLKEQAILHSSASPTDGNDAAATQFVRNDARLHAPLEHRVLRTLANGIQLIGIYDQGVEVNQYHGIL